MLKQKVTLFTSSSISLSLVRDLEYREILACVVISSRVDNDANLLLQTLIQNKIPYFQFDEKNDEMNIEILKHVDTNLGLVFSFPHKLSSAILEYFNYDIFNIHASPLPKYRGSQPLFWQLKNGDTQSALTLYKLTESLDDGDIIIQRTFNIDNKDTFGILSGLISQLVIDVVNDFFILLEKDSSNLPSIAQIKESSTTPKIELEDIVIKWDDMTSNDIFNLARACNPIFGGAQTKWKNSYISIVEATVMDTPNYGLEAGTILHIGSPEGLIVSTTDCAIRIDVISVPDGTFSGVRFAKRFGIDAGEKFSSY